MQVNLERDYLCSPDIVFSWLAEPEKAKVWMKGISKTEIIKNNAERIGTTFKEVMEENGKSIEMMGTITAYEPNRSIAFHLESRIHKLDVTYSTVGRGSLTTLIVASTIHWKFPMSILTAITGNKIKQGIVRQLDSELDELKKLCEASSK